MESNQILSPAVRRRRLSTFTGVEFLLSLCLSFVLFACSDMAMDEDASLPKTDKGVVTTPGLVPGIQFGETVALEKVDLYLNKGFGTTGLLSVTIRTMAGVFVDSITVSAASLPTGSGWRTFYFPTGAHVQRGQRYQVRVLRSNPHNYSRNDYIFWYASATGLNAYPEGTNDLADDTWQVDYAFRTYVGVDVDQRQLTIRNAFYTSNNEYRWQEFVVGTAPRVPLSSIQLYCLFGPSLAGENLTVTLRGLWESSNGGDSIKIRKVVPIAGLQSGAWNTVDMPASLQAGGRYSISVSRSGVHHFGGGKYFYWCKSDGSTDAYPDGNSSEPGDLPVDFAFRTFTSNGLDQEQASTLDTTRVAGINSVWQYFIPRR